MMKSSKRRWIPGLTCLLVSCLILTACKNYEKEQRELSDTPWRGTIHVSADESFKPVIDEQVKVYESRRPDSHIIVDYKPEAECLQDMLTDSVRLIIATRKPSDAERNTVSDSLKIGLESLVMARDAIAVIVHPNSPDSFFTMSEIKAILRGNFSKNLIPVFDGAKATSTIRFLIDSVLKGDTLTPKAMAARSSEEVVNYIARTPGAVGFVGVSWVGNKEDTAQLGFMKKVKMANIESTYMPGKYVLPYQINIYDGNYPMVRDLVYILRERHKGLGHGFSDFMAGDVGQLIFRRAYLMPMRRDFLLREAVLRK
jgi:phosphate transport system substrate-binding protein